MLLVNGLLTIYFSAEVEKVCVMLFGVIAENLLIEQVIDDARMLKTKTVNFSPQNHEHLALMRPLLFPLPGRK